MKATTKLTESLTEDVATTTFNQLKAFGWNGLPKWGARNFTKSGDALQFEASTPTRQRRKVVVKLDPSDTYTVEVWGPAYPNVKKLASTDDVYVEDLARTISDLLGY